MEYHKEHQLKNHLIINNEEGNNHIYNTYTYIVYVEGER